MVVMASRLEEILKEREKKIENLKLMGIYPAAHKDLANKEVVDNFEKYNGKNNELGWSNYIERAWEANFWQHKIKGRIQLYSS